ncbi:MAG: hypothetical protein ACUVX8_14030, partial [Candidatus Zipacnadales bacterium]
MLLGLERNNHPLVGDFCGTDIHGRQIYLRGEYDPYHIATAQITLTEATEDDIKAIHTDLKIFAGAFGVPMAMILSEPFTVLRPKSHRPFG